MNDDQLLTRLAESNAYPDDTKLPDAVWSREAALREIERRMGMRSQRTTQRPAAPERHGGPAVRVGRSGEASTPAPRWRRPRSAAALAVAAAALLATAIVGVTSLMGGKDPAPPATEPTTAVTTAAPPTTAVPEVQSFPRRGADLEPGVYLVSRTAPGYRITIGDGWRTTGGELGIGSSVSDLAFSGLLGTYTVLGHGTPVAADGEGPEPMPAFPEGLVIFAYSEKGNASAEVAITRLRESEQIRFDAEGEATLGSFTFTVIDTATGEEPYADYTATVDATPLQSVNYGRALILYPDHRQRFYVTDVAGGVIVAMAYGPDVEAIASQAEEILTSLTIEE